MCHLDLCVDTICVRYTALVVSSAPEWYSCSSPDLSFWYCISFSVLSSVCWWQEHSSVITCGIFMGFVMYSIWQCTTYVSWFYCFVIGFLSFNPACSISLPTHCCSMFYLSLRWFQSWWQQIKLINKFSLCGFLQCAYACIKAPICQCQALSACKCDGSATEWHQLLKAGQWDILPKCTPVLVSRDKGRTPKKDTPSEVVWSPQ